MEFREDFLQAVWKYQYFDKNSLFTADGQSLEIKKIGYHNQYEGPDFLEAHVRIGKIDYHGHVEIHIHSSDWNAHDHSSDTKYAPVILHVVWTHDKEINNQDGTAIPTLELRGRIFLDTMRNYERLTNSREEIICSPHIERVPEIVRFSMLEKALVEKLEHKSHKLAGILTATNNDWEETTFRWLLYCFGFKTNADTMLQLATKLPFRQLLKLQQQPQAIRAILFGMAGLLPDQPEDEEGKALQKEFAYQNKKLKLSPPLHRNDWKFLGVRPPGFPTVRLAQLAELIGKQQGFFSTLLNGMDSFGQFQKSMDIQLPEYWRNHYKLGQPSPRIQSAKLGSSTLHLLAINLLVPLWYEYGKYTQQSEWKEKCFDFLQTLPAEENHIIRKYTWIESQQQSAFESQALIGLFQDYCQPKRCLHCKIGQSLLKPEKK